MTEDEPEKAENTEDVAEARPVFRPAAAVPAPDFFPQAGPEPIQGHDPVPTGPKRPAPRKKKTSVKQTPLYYGHRERLRTRFRVDDGKSMPDYELLELVLFAAIARRDVKPLAKTLIDRFGSFAEVLSAPQTQLEEIEGVTENVATHLKIITAAALRLMKEEVLHRPVLSSWGALTDYCAAAMARSQREEFRVLFLDRKNALIADEVQSTGTVDHTPVYPREILKRTLELNASAIILVHNHPSGDPTPSKADIVMTHKIAEAARALKITVHDHIIVGRGGYASFKSFGLL